MVSKGDKVVFYVDYFITATGIVEGFRGDQVKLLCSDHHGRWYTVLRNRRHIWRAKGHEKDTDIDWVIVLLAFVFTVFMGYFFFLILYGNC